MTPEAFAALDTLRFRLHQLVFSSIRHGHQHDRPLTVRAADWPDPLATPGACFVSLHLAGGLRGCIGSIEPHRPLVEDIAANAFAAALRDPRFAPVSVTELIELELSIAILGTPERLSIQSQQDLIEQLHPPHDGLILAAGPRRAVFLPQVWEQLPRPQDFVWHLLRKAQLPDTLQPPMLKAWRFAVHAL